ncbi:MAG: DinB family protein [Terriglobales bacterium]|jgi:uncharacterized damage-inducible protein DinB
MVGINLKTTVADDPSATQLILDFVRCHVNDEWDRLLNEFSKISDRELTFQPATWVHSIGWHVRHVIEWRYALLHVLIGGNRNEEHLTCLGWENEPLVHGLTSIRSWHEPSYAVTEDIRFAQRVRDVTERDLLSLPPARYWETVTFPWRTNRLLDEIFQDTRHFALHRGQIRQIRQTYARLLSGAG